MIDHLQMDGQQSQQPSYTRHHSEEIFPRHNCGGGEEREGRGGQDIAAELSRNRELYRHQEVRPPFTYAALIKQVRKATNIFSIDALKIFHSIPIPGAVRGAGAADEPERDLLLVLLHVRLLPPQPPQLEERGPAQPLPPQHLPQGREHLRRGLVPYNLTREYFLPYIFEHLHPASTI